ncbi:MAG: hypothetical protein AAB573_03640 [Patescibacteria group bacterium]
MQDRIENIEKDLEAIKERNVRVEGDKAWETSWFRIGTVAVITYAVAALALFAIDNDYPFRNALIPTIGYILSTQSLPRIKEWWIKSQTK